VGLLLGHEHLVLRVRTEHFGSTSADLYYRYSLSFKNRKYPDEQNCLIDWAITIHNITLGCERLFVKTVTLDFSTMIKTFHCLQ